MRNRVRNKIEWIAAAAIMLSACAFASGEPRNVCVDCHSKQAGALLVSTADATSDVHSHKGMSCNTCHGGDTQNEAQAKSAASKFRGHIRREQINDLCGSCHSDVTKIKQFNPALATDQLAKYHSSVHGVKFAKGDTKVAVCTDCHGAHGIRPASDPHSPVHPLNVATTCKRCHDDAEYMKSYGIKTSQFKEYEKSVHHEAMTARGDLSAPTCTTCHGSHGAVPDGVQSVTNVCGTCHAMQAKFFSESSHKEQFAEGCTTCHGSHGIQHPTDEFIGLGAESACASCHGKDDDGGKTAGAIHDQLTSLVSEIATAKSVLDSAERAGMDVADARVELAGATEALTKARVSLHTAQLARVNEDVQGGLKIASKARAVGDAALAERRNRRRALWFPLSTIAFVVVSLIAAIRTIERNVEG